MGLADNMPLDAIGDLKRQMRDLERQIREMRAERRLESATIGAGGLTVKGGKIAVVDPVTGATLALLDASGLTVNGNAAFGGNTTIGGNLAVTGTLSLPAGIINNDALAQPVSPKVAHGSGDSFGVTNGSGDVVATATVTVPAGFTRALVIAVASVSAFNTSASHDSLFASAIVDGGGSGWLNPTDVEPSRLTTVTNAATALLTGLGSSFTVQALAATNTANWSAYGGNVANIDATVLFLR